MKTLTTKVHTYRFDVSKPSEAEAYKAFRTRMGATDGPGCFEVLGNHAGPTFTDGEILTLETKHVFSNQWNETTRRVFDWYQAVWPNADIKEGYWIEQTDKMRQVRRDTLTCGYCGKHYQVSEDFVTCGACLGSEYLKREELHLTRLKPAGEHFPKRAPLTKREAHTLEAHYEQAQELGIQKRNTANTARARQRIELDLVDGLAKAEADRIQAHHKHEVHTWMMDNGFGRQYLDNLIYYSHTGRWCFGWRKRLTDLELNALLEKTSEAPFDYDIKEG